jgi:hypothetical protein
MTTQSLSSFVILFILFSCQNNAPLTEENQIRFEKISRYHSLDGKDSEMPFLTKITYYFDNGLPHFWIEMDSLGRKIHEHTFEYDAKWNSTNSINKENLDDSAFKITEINDRGDWTKREAIREDGTQEVQKRVTSYNSDFKPISERFYEGIISDGEWDENMLNFSKNGEYAFFTRGKSWEKQLPFITQLQNGIYTKPTQIGIMDTIYNGAISPSRNQIIYCKRLPETTEIWLVKKENNEWKNPKNLTEKTGISGGYFNWFDETEIYFYINENSGDLVKGNLINDRLKIDNKLDKLNTDKGTEFSPYVDKEKRFILFTRYLEGDKSQQGIFVSYNQGERENPEWGDPQKIETLEYGWGAFISDDGKDFFYTDGVDIFNYAFDSLKLNLYK